MPGPRAFGRRLGGEHDHSSTGEGGDSISPESVLDNVDGQAWETLREIGYEVGNFFPLKIYHANDSRGTSTTSTTYSLTTAIRHVVSIGVGVPSGATMQVVFGGEFHNDTSGEDTSARIRNRDDGFTVIDSLTITDPGSSTFGETAPKDYSPGVDPFTMDLSIKVTGGTGGVNNPYAIFGVKL